MGGYVPIPSIHLNLMYSLTDLQPAYLAFLLNSSTSASVTRRRITVERTVDGSGALVLMILASLDYNSLLLARYASYYSISIWILPLPVPAIPTHLFDTVFGFPSKFCPRFTRIRVAGGDISRTPVINHIWNLDIIDSFKSFHDIKNTVSFACAEIIDSHAAILFLIASSTLTCPFARSTTWIQSLTPVPSGVS